MKRVLIALLVFSVVFISPAFALNANERLWVIGEESTQPSTFERSLHVLNPAGLKIREISGQWDPVPLTPPYFSVNGPWIEFVHARDSSGVYAATDKGIVWKKVFTTYGSFYVHRQNLVYMLHSGGLSKITLLGDKAFQEKFILKSSDYGQTADLNSRIAVDRLGRVYFSIGNHLFRYTELTSELLDEVVDFSVLSIDTSVDKAYIAAGEDGVIEVSSSFGFSEFSDLSPVNYVAVDAQGNVFAAVGNPGGNIWQIAPNGTETPFSSLSFNSITGLAITHGELA